MMIMVVMIMVVVIIIMMNDSVDDERLKIRGNSNLLCICT